MQNEPHMNRSINSATLARLYISLYLRVGVERELVDLEGARVVHAADDDRRVAVGERYVDHTPLERLKQRLLIEPLVEDAYATTAVHSDRVGEVLVALVHSDEVAVRVALRPVVVDQFAHFDLFKAGRVSQYRYGAPSPR